MGGKLKFFTQRNRIENPNRRPGLTVKGIYFIKNIIFLKNGTFLSYIAVVTLENKDESK